LAFRFTSSRHIHADLSLSRCMKPNGRDQRARPEMLVIVEVSVGRAPLDQMLGRAFNNNPIEQTRLLRRE
jgi:hypothetical protein